MIIGIGNDIVDARRIAKTLSKSHGDTFKKRVFTDNEIAYCERMSNSSPNFAARWALKEAFYKGLPEELQPLSHWKAIELTRGDSKKPVITICDSKLKAEFEKRGITFFHSISHEKEYCTAVVIFES
jgi:holo-[acyl-carrier protein] synthase